MNINQQINQLNRKINDFFRFTSKDELIAYGVISLGVLLIIIGLAL